MSKLLTARLGSEIAQQANVRHNGTGNGMTVSLISFTLGWLLKCCLHPGTKYWCVVAISVYFAPLRTRFTRMSSKSIQLWHAMYFLERPAPASSFSSNWKRCNTFCFHSLPGWQNGSWKGREFGLCCAQPIWLVLSLVTREQTGLAMALQVPKLAMQRTNLSSQARKASWGMRVGSRQSLQHILWSCIHWYLIRICNCWEPFVMCVCGCAIGTWPLGFVVTTLGAASFHFVDSLVPSCPNCQAGVATLLCSKLQSPCGKSYEPWEQRPKLDWFDCIARIGGSLVPFEIFWAMAWYWLMFSVVGTKASRSWQRNRRDKSSKSLAAQIAHGWAL